MALTISFRKETTTTPRKCCDHARRSEHFIFVPIQSISWRIWWFWMIWILWHHPTQIKGASAAMPPLVELFSTQMRVSQHFDLSENQIGGDEGVGARRFLCWLASACGVCLPKRRWCHHTPTAAVHEWEWNHLPIIQNIRPSVPRLWALILHKKEMKTRFLSSRTQWPIKPPTTQTQNDTRNSLGLGT